MNKSARREQIGCEKSINVGIFLLLLKKAVHKPITAAS
jgi:F0F1-type ATP synthase membrane subunit b/b'